MAKHESTPPPRNWRWQPGDGSSTGLQYEPGNWGDALKGAWALRVTKACALDEKTFRYLDVYAGAPDYPLTQPSRTRLTVLAGNVYAAAQQRYLARNRLASTATLVRDAAQTAGARVQVQVFDLDGERRQAWSTQDVSVLEADDALRAFDRACGQHEAPALTLIDPYNLVHHWGAWLSRVEKLARRAPVLLYGYDKSPRGEGHADQYRRMAQAFDKTEEKGIALCRGRVPADAQAPRAWHEMLLLGPAETVEPLRTALADDVAALLGAMET